MEESFSEESQSDSNLESSNRINESSGEFSTENSEFGDEKVETSKQTFLGFPWRIVMISFCFAIIFFLLILTLLLVLYFVFLSDKTGEKLEDYVLRNHDSKSLKFSKQVISYSKNFGKNGFSFSSSDSNGVVYPLSNLLGKREYQIKGKCNCFVECSSNEDCRETSKFCSNYKCVSKKESKRKIHLSKAKMSWNSENKNWIFYFENSEDLLVSKKFGKETETETSRRKIESLAIPVQFGIFVFIMASSFLVARESSMNILRDKCLKMCPDETKDVEVNDVEVIEFEEEEVDEDYDPNMKEWICGGYCIPNKKVLDTIDYPNMDLPRFCETHKFVGMVDAVDEKSAEIVYRKDLLKSCYRNIFVPEDWITAEELAIDKDIVKKLSGKLCLDGALECDVEPNSMSSEYDEFGRPIDLIKKEK